MAIGRSQSDADASSNACAGCARIAGRETEPLFIATLSRSHVFLFEHQRYAGHCVLFAREHVEHLADLALAAQTELFGDVARVAQAVCAAVNPRRLNYECLGNVLAHVHWHVVPRHADDPEPRSVIWTRPADERECGVAVEQAREMVGKIRIRLR